MIFYFDLLYWIYLLYFLLAITIAFLIPGLFLFPNLKVTTFQRFILSINLGIIFWGLQGFIFGYLNLRWFTYIYLVFFVMSVIRKKSRRLDLAKLHKRNIDKAIFIIILLGVVIQMIPNAANGIGIKEGLFFGAWIPDGQYFISVTSEVVKNIPPNEPGIVNTPIKNYHYMSSIIMGELIRVFMLPLVSTVNQFFPLFLSVLLGLNGLILAQLLRINKLFTRLLLFFLYFSGDSIFFITFILGKGFHFDITLLEDAFVLWNSIPRYFGIVIFFFSISMLLLYLETKKLSIAFISAISIGILISFKVYIGIFSLVGISFLLMYEFFIKKSKKTLVFLLAFIVAFFLYLPVNSNAGGIFFSGLWRFHDFAANLGLSEFLIIRDVYLQHQSWIRVFQYESMFALLYIVCLFGIYLLGFFQSKNTLSQFPLGLHIFLLSGFFVSLLLGFFFLQVTGGANTSQFLFSVYLVGILYTSLAITYWVGKLKTSLRYIVVIFLCIGVTIRVVYEINKFQKKFFQNDGLLVKNSELQAIDFLRQNTKSNDTILVDQSLDQEDKKTDTSLYYIHFLSGRTVYLIGTGILKDHGYNVKEMMIIRDSVLHGDIEAVKKSKADYMYLSSENKIDYQLQRYLTSVFKNDTIQIYKVDRDQLENKKI